jgi:levansucrase
MQSIVVFAENDCYSMRDDNSERFMTLAHTDERLAACGAMCSHWTAAQLAVCQMDAEAFRRFEAPVIGAADAQPIIPGLTVWDLWPVQLDDGAIAEISGGQLWIILSAPRRDDPNMRHDEARMRLLHRVDDDWRDCGDLLPDGFSPGSREWSGSARLDPATGHFTLWFTAAGRRGDTARSFEQRLFHATAKLDLAGDRPRLTGWANLSQCADNDGTYYADLAISQGTPGLIKGFRDPYWFRDPADGKGFILFAGSKPSATSQSDYDGVIGIAAAQDDEGENGFTLLPHLIDADGLANELELPHVIARDGLYYLFWSTQAHVFAPGGPAGPTGLYGMVAPSLFGPYEPLNGSGLVLANPIAAPRQAYAWKVQTSLEVASFVDLWGVNGRDNEADSALNAMQFGGTIAPMIQISLNGATTQIVANEK